MKRSLPIFICAFLISGLLFSSRGLLAKDEPNVLYLRLKDVLGIAIINKGQLPKTVELLRDEVELLK